MAKSLDDFKNRFNALKKAVDTLSDEIESSQNNIKNHFGVIQEGCKEIGTRIAKLRLDGVEGKTLDDYRKADPETATLYNGTEQFINSIATEAGKHQGFKTRAQKIVSDTTALANEMDAEIKDRKKALSTKLGTGNKSLPDMEKLRKELASWSEGQYNELTAFSPSTVDFYKNKRTTLLNAAVSKAPAVVLKADEQELDAQGMNVRHLGNTAGKVKTQLDVIYDALSKGTGAAGSGDAEEVANQKKRVVQPLQVIEQEATKVERAAGNSTIKHNIGLSKDKGKILAFVKTILEARTEARGAAKQVALLKVQEK